MRKKSFFVAFLALACACTAAALPVLAGNADEVVYVLDSCDNATNCTTSKIADTANFAEGSGCMYSNNEAGRVSFEFRNIDYSALPRYSSAWLEFYYWIEDAENINIGQIELTSSGYEDVQELNYDIGKASGFKTGWNFVSVKLSSMRNEGFSYNKIFGFRVFMLPANGQSFVCRVDNIVLSSVSHKEQVEREGIVPLSKRKESLKEIKSENAVE